MIFKILLALWRLTNRERIPKLPRGMLAERYSAVDGEEVRVLARLGARSPVGVLVAMKRAGVKTIPELVARLEHFTPRRRVLRRLDQMYERLSRSTPYHPYQRAIMESERRSKRGSAHREASQRIDAVIQAFKQREGVDQ